MPRKAADPPVADERLQRLTSRYEAILAAVPDIIVEVDQNRVYTWANPAALEFFGDDMLGKEAAYYFAGEQDTYEKVQSLFSGDESVFYLESWQHRRDGQKRLLGWWCRVLKDGAGNVVGALSTARDITVRLQAEQAREQLEAQLRQAQKMDAFGQLAGGVAHDFNNVLTAIMGNAEMLRDQVEQSAAAPQEWTAYLDQIDRAAQRAASLTRQLLAFTRQQATQQELLDLNRILADMRKMLERLISEAIVLELVLSADLAGIWADSGQVEQVVMNLVLNARDALPGGGRVVLETANVASDAAYAAAHPEGHRGPYVMLVVRDNGCGMPPEVLSRIFEPFFTTKPLGQGTGLGLATVYGIVGQAGGHVTVSSAPGCGSTFKVFWPAAAAPARPQATAPDDRRVLRGRETVLVCEDDPAVRELTAGFLRDAGYTVLAAGNGQRALEQAATWTGPIHLLVTDVIMPDRNGRQLADALTATRPELKTLFMSGYTSNVIAHHGVLEAGMELLEKPFTRERLLLSVRTRLDQPQPAARPV